MILPTDDTVTYSRPKSAFTYSDTFAPDHYQSIDKALNETRENIRKGIEEAIQEIPRNTHAINDYQEQSLQAVKEITDSYLDSQKEIIITFQSMWSSYLESIYKAFWNWASPQDQVNYMQEQ